jgi:hypothetical protein
VTTGRSRGDRAVAPATAAVTGATRRTRAVPGPEGEPAPTTAQLIRRTDASISRPTYAALGVALHHFTEILDRRVDTLDLHRATAVLTKQVCHLLDDDDVDDVLDAIRRLVTDPDRVALPDGRRAAELCGKAWDDVRGVALQRATASCEGAQEFGRDAIVNLAAVRGVGAITPWWGTPMWRQRVDLVHGDTISTGDRELLLDEPETARDTLLSMVLNDRGTSPRGRSAQSPESADPAHVGLLAR